MRELTQAEKDELKRARKAMKEQITTKPDYRKVSQGARGETDDENAIRLNIESQMKNSRKKRR